MTAALDWQGQAACIGRHQAFDDDTTAKQLCKGCPVVAACLLHALASDERFGVWGGLTDAERQRIKRGQTVTPARAVEYVPVRAEGHGRYRYLHHHCHCEVCRADNAAYMRAFSERRRVPKVCEVCGGDVRGRGRSRFCSTDCRIVAAHPGSWRAERVAAKQVTA